MTFPAYCNPLPNNLTRYPVGTASQGRAQSRRTTSPRPATRDPTNAASHSASSQYIIAGAGSGAPAASELDARLKRDHARRVVATQAHSEQSCRWRGGVSKRSKSRLSRRLPRNPRQHHAGESEIRVVKHIEKLSFQPQLGVLGQGEPLGKVEVIPDEIGARAGRCGRGFRIGRSSGCLRPRKRRCWGQRWR